MIGDKWFERHTSAASIDLSIGVNEAKPVYPRWKWRKPMEADVLKLAVRSSLAGGGVCTYDVIVRTGQSVHRVRKVLKRMKSRGLLTYSPGGPHALTPPTYYATDAAKKIVFASR